MKNNINSAVINFNAASAQLDNDLLFFASDIAAKVFNNSDSKEKRAIFIDISVHSAQAGRNLSKIKSQAGARNKYKTIAKLVVVQDGKKLEDDLQLELLIEKSIASYPSSDSRNNIRYKGGYIYTIKDSLLDIDNFLLDLNPPKEEATQPLEDTKEEPVKTTKRKTKSEPLEEDLQTQE